MAGRWASVRPDPCPTLCDASAFRSSIAPRAFIPTPSAADSAREFTDREIVERAKQNARNHHFDLDLVKKIADQGYLGAIVPREYGGAGLDYLSYGLIVEEIGRGDSARRVLGKPPITLAWMKPV